jgi:outer membrane protein OmpA-like peptidoglycan-associated protein
MPLAFSTEVRQPPKLRLHRNGLDLKRKELTVVFGSTAQKIEMEVVGETGDILVKKTVPFRGQARGTPLKLQWETESTVKVMKIALVAHDAKGFFSPLLALYPWRLTIPHEEVVFETASNAILESEVPKLNDVLPRIQKRIKQYSSLIPVRLFVLGHTDTVGPTDTNRSLSQKRASAIAKWFQKQGIEVPIFIRGFGESDLRVSTGDNIDEEANRRADYILSVDPPNHRAWQGWITIQGQKPSGGQ